MKANMLSRMKTLRRKWLWMALLAYLQTLPASSIDKIEVTTAPGSSFRGEGNFGVIHIKQLGTRLEY